MAEMIKKATRQSYGDALAKLAEINDRVVVFDADLAGTTKAGEFKKVCPERFFGCGIAEANMMVVAAGASTCGLVPFASSFAMFAAGRAYEQVRNSIGYPHLNVKIGSTHAGVSVGEDGATHQCIEDIALMRAIPGMTVICPADYIEGYAAVLAAAEYQGPVYLRFSRLNTPVFNSPDYKFQMGKGITLREGSDVTVVATGLLVYEAMGAADSLASEGISVRVINIHTIKPIDQDLIKKAAKETGVLVTAEEHSVIGGLGAAVAEAIGEECPVPIIRIGIQDIFGHSGKGDELLEEFGFCSDNIAAQVRRALALKKGRE